MNTFTFWRDTAERAVRSAAAAVLVFAGADEQHLLRHPDWRSWLSVAVSAATVSVLFSLVGSRIGDPQTASLLSIPPVVKGTGDGNEPSR